MSRALLLSLLTVTVLALTTGCEQKFTRQRYDMIQVGVDRMDDVRQMIGEPEFAAGDVWYYEDHEGRYAARVFFDRQDVVRAKNWMDLLKGTWEGQNPDADPPPAGEVRERELRLRQIDKD